MLGILKSLLVVVLATRACAAPTPAPGPAPAPAPLAAAGSRTPKRSTFIVRRYENPHYVRDGALAMRHAYEKHGWALPEALAPVNITDGSDGADGIDSADSADNRVRVAAASSSSSAPHVLPAETQFLAPVTIGGQAFTMNLDTGSADLYVFFFSFSFFLSPPFFFLRKSYYIYMPLPSEFRLNRNTVPN
jgi:hypothetical protein